MDQSPCKSRRRCGVQTQHHNPEWTVGGRSGEHRLEKMRMANVARFFHNLAFLARPSDVAFGSFTNFNTRWLHLKISAWHVSLTLQLRAQDQIVIYAFADLVPLTEKADERPHGISTDISRPLCFTQHSRVSPQSS